jgi:8-oxo-dGTP diphosphatase
MGKTEGPRVAVSAIILRNRKIVLVRRKNPPLAGEWSLPGGSIQLGETLHDAVRREVLEETGLRVRPDKAAYVRELIFPEHHYVVISYVCRVTRGKLKAGSDSLEARWVGRADLEDFHLSDSTLQLILEHLAQPN